MSRWHDESVRRYAVKLENMNEIEFAQEGLRHLRISLLVTVVVMIIGCAGCTYIGEWPGAWVAAMMFAVLGWVSMFFCWLELRKKVRGERNG